MLKEYREYLERLQNPFAGKHLRPESRPMWPHEIARVRTLFGDSVPYKRVVITRDSIVTLVAPNALGYTVNLMSDWGHFVEETMELSDQGFYTMVHELTHVWQYVHGGGAYIADSLLKQARASLGQGDRNAAYDWNAALDAGLPWERWGAEQQAQAASDFFLAVDRVEQDQSPPEIMENARRTVAVLRANMERTREGFGAPSFV